MTADVTTLVHYQQEVSTRRQHARIERFFITLLLIIGICGFTVITLEANGPGVDLSGLEAAADTPMATQGSFVRQ